MSARGAEIDVTRGSQQTLWEETTNFGPVTQVSLGRVREMVMERRPTKEGQVSGAFKELVEVGRPMTVPLKGPVVVERPTIEMLNGVRACGGGLRDYGEQEGEIFGSQLESSSPALNLTVITNEALMVEASRYTDHYTCSLFCLRKQDISLSSTPSGRDGVSVANARDSDWGSGSKAVGGAVLGPLRVILADGREAEVFDLAGKAFGAFEEELKGVSERASQKDVEERDEEGEPCWHSSSLAKFSCYHGMPTEGFEGEILFLLKRMKERKLQKGKLNGRKRKKLESSKLERELRKLEWTVNYLGGGGEGGRSTCRSK